MGTVNTLFGLRTLSVLVLLGSCAAMVSASSRAHRTGRHHRQQQVRHETITVVKKGEPELRQEIHEILEKLFIPTEHPDNDPSKGSTYRSPGGRLLPSGERQDYIIRNVITYAFHYLRGLEVSSGPKIDGMNGAFWNRNSFSLRAHNFGWDRLPLPQQYLEMTRTLLKLVELVESAFGESSQFRDDESRREKNDRSYSLAGVKEDLQQAIKEICEFYHIDDVPPQGLPSNPPPMGHPGEEPQPAAAPTPASFDVASFMEQLHGMLTRFSEAFFAKLKGRLDKVQVAREPSRHYEKPYQGGMEW